MNNALNGGETDIQMCHSRANRWS